MWDAGKEVLWLGMGVSGGVGEFDAEGVGRWLFEVLEDVAAQFHLLHGQLAVGDAIPEHDTRAG
jgi:hypothetical protein